ncbi:MAG: HAD family hydrolase [Pirellulaceae bacterium]
MNNHHSNGTPSVLATDLDGTFIPLTDNADNDRDLASLRDHFAGNDQTLVFVTGRHLESALHAIVEHALPTPD